MQSVSKSTRKIKQKAYGTCNGTIVDMAAEICKVLERLNHRLTKLENATCCKDESGRTTKPAEELVSEKSEADNVSVPVHEVPTEIQDGPADETVSEPPVSKPQAPASVQSSKATGKTRKSNKNEK